MAFYWFWEDVSPVRRLRDEYDGVLDDLENNNKRMNIKIEGIRSNSNSIHKTLKSYGQAQGVMAELYYAKIEQSESSYKQAIVHCYDVLSQIERKKQRAVQIRNQLNYYYKIEQREDKQFSLWEISL